MAFGPPLELHTNLQQPLSAQAPFHSILTVSPVLLSNVNSNESVSSKQSHPMIINSNIDRAIGTLLSSLLCSCSV
jgi:hypothetical protein